VESKRRLEDFVFCKWILSKTQMLGEDVPSRKQKGGVLHLYRHSKSRWTPGTQERGYGKVRPGGWLKLRLSQAIKWTGVHTKYM
jgi:hypothetical protein